MSEGNAHHSGAPAKLKALCPKQDFVGGRFSYVVDEERVL
jgi:hypothetical protein